VALYVSLAPALLARRGGREGDAPVSAELVRADLLVRLEQGGALTATGLDLRTRPDLTFEQYRSVCALVGRAASAVRWWAGDLVLIGDALYGEEAAQALEELRLSPEGIAESARVAAAFPPSKRSAALSFGHHRVLAGRWLEMPERIALLDRAEREGLSVRALEAVVRERRALASLHVEDARDGCDDFEQSIQDLHAKASRCYGSAAVEVLVRAPGVEYRVEIGGTE
jgi:hypothetical protein